MKYILSWLAITALMVVYFSSNITNVKASGPTNNFFGIVPWHSQGLEIYTEWHQTPDLFEAIYSPHGLSDINAPDAIYIYFIETGMLGNNTAFTFDPKMHPYESYQDGLENTYYMFIDHYITLTAGAYGWRVSHVSQNNFATYLGYSYPTIWQQMGLHLQSTTHDEFLYTGVGFESSTNTRFKETLKYTGAKFQWSFNQVWYAFCPYGYPPAGFGTVYAVISSCTQIAGGANFSISPGLTAFMSKIGS